MKRNNLQQLFIDELAEIYDAELQIVEALPLLIKASSASDLKEGLTKHLNETKNQVARIEKIFSILGVNLQDKKCKGMRGLLIEGEDLLKKQNKSPTLDAAIIGACQKVEHYEIAAYGTLKSFAKQLDFDSEIIDLLKDTLDEEAGADKTLTKVAEGSVFSTGVNRQAAEEAAHSTKRR